MPAPRARARAGLYGIDRATGDVGRVAGGRAQDLSGAALARRRRDGAAEERLRRAHPAGERAARTHERGDGQVPRALPPAGRIATADADVAARDPDRRRARGRRRARRRLRRVAVRQSAPEAVHQRAARLDPRRGAARVLPTLAESAGGHGARQPFRAGRFARRDRSCDRGVPSALAALTGPCRADWALAALTGVIAPVDED